MNKRRSHKSSHQSHNHKNSENLFFFELLSFFFKKNEMKFFTSSVKIPTCNPMFNTIKPTSPLVFISIPTDILSLQVYFRILQAIVIEKIFPIQASTKIIATMAQSSPVLSLLISACKPEYVKYKGKNTIRIRSSIRSTISWAKLFFLGVTTPKINAPTKKKYLIYK